MLRDKALAAAGRYQMLEKGDHVVCGVSGGADSMALLLFFLEIREDYGLNLTVCHVNHLLRGEEADRDEAFVRNFCRNRDLDFRLCRRDIRKEAEENGLSQEEYGRRARYAFFEEVAGEVNGKIATAHTQNDQAETILFHLARGTGIRGLCGIPPVRGRIIRPLLDCSREEVEDYLRSRGQSYVEDGTNAKTVYTRNKIRHEIIPRLEEVNAGFSANAAAAASQLREIDGYLGLEAGRLLEKARQGGGYSTRILGEAHPALLSRAVWQAVGNCGVSPNSSMIFEISGMISGEGGKLNIQGDWYALVKDSCFTLSSLPKDEVIPFQIAAHPGENPVYPGKTVILEEIAVDSLESLKFVHGSPLKNVIDCDRIGKNLTLRNRQAGDKFRPLGRGLTKSLKKMMNEAGVPLEERSRRVLLCDSSGILWVEGFGVSQEAAASSGTKRALLLRTEQGVKQDV